jgi:hypothetical protein
MSNINIGYTELAKIAETVRGYLESIDTLKNDCATAGEEAVKAGGGDTRVANAIKSAIVDVSDSQFEAVKKVIEDFADAISKVSTLYKTYDDNMVEGIEAIAAKRQSLLESQAQTTNGE